jgi:hypothetical protein
MVLPSAETEREGRSLRGHGGEGEGGLRTSGIAIDRMPVRPLSPGLRS